ncbi:hypothetical protein HMPREF0493_1581 [Lactobacillus amylolyticus DSM 11664]|uniref:Uncharacterized protein n=1 Tax=Lactobacillus amylolyticus DSM 11664 TaxID=585524 RepID=D4YVM0_9LACO|nr:hypothetical protein HMPREF0493_1581 [Lactobacillus amylolyticus DSM 11664]
MAGNKLANTNGTPVGKNPLSGNLTGQSKVKNIWWFWIYSHCLQTDWQGWQSFIPR